MPDLKVPFRYVDLAEPGRTQLYRNFEEIQRKLDAHTHPAGELGEIPASQVLPGVFQASLDFRFPSLMVGNKAHESPTAGYIHTAGTLSGINMEDRKGTGHPAWVIYPDTGRLGIWTGGTGAQGTRIQFEPSGLARFGTGLDGAYIGEHPIHSQYAAFGHVALENSTPDYCLLQHSNGTTILNSSAATSVSLRVGGSTKLVATDTWVTINPNLTAAAEAYSNSWFRSNTSGKGWYHQAHGGGWYMSDNTWVRVYSDRGIYTANAESGGGIVCRVAKINRWGSDTYGSFGHSSALGYGGHPYGFMMSNSGQCWIGALDFIRFYCDSTWCWEITAPGDYRFITDIPILGALDDMGRTNTSSRQWGRYTSSANYKTDIRDAGLGAENPIFDLTVRRFWYDSKKVGNGAHINQAYPDGLVGLVAEEVGETLFQGANWWRDNDGVPRFPTTLDLRCLMAHVVGGLQYHEARGAAQEDRVAQLEEAVAKIEQVPMVKAVLGKG